VEVRAYGAAELPAQLPRLEAYAMRAGPVPLSRHPAWLSVLHDGLGHDPCCLEVVEDGRTRGLLPLACVRGLLFGRFLVSLPYLNYGGVLADDDDAAHLLIDRAVGLADHLGVRFLELRHEGLTAHPALTEGATDKVHMRRPLPATADELWRELSCKVRNQVRKGQKSGLTVAWGGEELLADFYAVFSHNMRDLGTPAYGRRLFRAVLRHFPGRAEFCVVRAGAQPAAAGLLLHGRGVAELPSASSIRAFNPTCANVLLYWHLLERAVERGQALFDFGRCTADGNNYRFKKQWGAEPFPARWQYHLRAGTAHDMRPSNPRFQKLIQLWQQLPLWLAGLLGPRIVRGIP
jgi:FemAB-related protein (PEP-CTERM system-associated)